MEILELGCGLHRTGDTTVGIDKVKTEGVDIVRDFAKRGIPFSDNYFDQVRAYDVIEHIEDYEDLIFLFNEIWRVLKNGGLFHFTTPNGIEKSLGHLTHHRGFTVGSLEYLKRGINKEMDHMREADGIEANFLINWVDDASDYHKEVLEGKFYAKKEKI